MRITKKLTNLSLLKEKKGFTYSSEFGEILGTGYHTVVMTVKENLIPKKVKETISSPVLVITTDRYKKYLYKEISGCNVVTAEVDFLNKEILEEEGINYFFTEKLEVVEIPEDYIVFLMESVKREVPLSSNGELYTSIEDIEFSIEKNNLEYLERDLEAKANMQLIEELLTATRNGLLKAIDFFKSIKYTGAMSIDIHEFQFVRKNGELIFIDPFSYA